MSQKATIVSLTEYLAPTTIPGYGVNKADFKYKVLAEGDSWFNFNRLAPEENLLQHLEFEQSTIIVNVALSGATVQKMAAGKPTANFKNALKEEKFNLILLSCGGNDLINAFCGEKYNTEDGTRLSLLQKSDSLDFKAYINFKHLEFLMSEIKKDLLTLLDIRNKATKNKTTPALVHTYDLFTMRNNIESDSPRYDRFTDLDVPPKLWIPISDFLVKTLAETLKSLRTPANNLIVVDTLECLDRADSLQIGNSNDWRNEIHPNHKGYEKLSKLRVNPELKVLLP